MFYLKRVLIYFNLLLSFCLSANTTEFIQDSNDFTRIVKAIIPNDIDSKKMTHFQIMNPFSNYEYSKINDLKKQKNGKVIYHANYTIKEAGTRYVPGSTKKDRHLIVSGDSTIFGVGVEDNETIPFYLQKGLKDFEVVNLGIGGGGPLNLHYFLDNFGIQSVLSNRSIDGVMIYQFEFYLIERIIGTKEYAKWGGTQPFYELENGKLLYKGKFEEQFKYRFYNFLNSIKWIDRLIPNLPRIGDSEFDIVSKVLLELEAKYRRQTKATNRFILVLNPTGLFNDQKIIWEKMKQAFKRNGVSFVEIPFAEKNKIELIPLDGHFTKNGNRFVADWILKLLNF